MRCSDFEPLVFQIARAPSLEDDPAGRQTLAHAEECKRCAARLAEEQALLAGARTVMADLADLQAPARLEEVLLTAFRKQAAAKRSGSPLLDPARVRLSSPARVRCHWQWIMAAAAALIVVAASAVAFLRYQSDEVGRLGKLPVVTKVPVTPPAQWYDPAKAAPDPGTKMAGGRAPARKPNPRRSLKPLTEHAETTTDYFPLTDEDDLKSLDSAQVVRVELPASALITVGLGVDPNSDAETVKADVLLGQDGLARAIRFVR